MKQVSGDYEFSVATTLDDLVDSFKVRACAFVAEQDCPMDDEFDGNDYSGTHLIVRKDGKVVATTRLRYFSGFVKAERTAILKGHRDIKLFINLLNFIFTFAESKGFEEIYTQADERMQKIYTRFGFRVIGNGEPIEHFGSTYVAMARRSSLDKDIVTLASSPDVLNSVEGSWLANAVS